MGRANSQPDRGQLAAEDVAAAVAELGLTLTRRQVDQLAAFGQLLIRWNAVHNLTSVTKPDDVISHHLLDSLVILPTIAAICGDHECRLLDVGSGGGLPGVPLAIARPDWHIALIDKVAKKVAFTTQVKLDLGLGNIEPVHGRAEKLTLPPFHIVTARAFTSLSELVRLTRHLLVPGGWWAAMKGAHPLAELAALATEARDVRVIETITLNVPRLGAERHLILLQRP